MITLQRGQAFHFHRGILDHDLLIGEPEGTTVRATSGASLVALRPTFAEYVLKMKRTFQRAWAGQTAHIPRIAQQRATCRMSPPVRVRRCGCLGLKS